MVSGKKSVKKYTVIFVLLILYFFMFTIILRMFTKNIIVEKMNINNGLTQLILSGMDTSDAIDEATGKMFVRIKWVERYPFEEKNSDNVSVSTQGGYEQFEEKYKSIVSKIKGVTENYCNSYLVGRTSLVEKAYAYENVIGWSLTARGNNDEIVQCEDGYLVNVQNESDMTGIVEHMQSFSSFLEAQDVELLYVQAPSKIAPNNGTLPPGITDKTNENMDKLLAEFRKSGIECLDLREYIQREYSEYENAFYKTDHHWKTTTAFDAAKEIAGYLNDKFQFQFTPDVFADANYKSEVYEKYFLGSLGKKVTLSVAEPEDYELIVPLYDTRFSVSIPEREIELKDNFQNTLLDYRHLETIDYYGENCYASFMNRNDAYAIIENEIPLCNEEKKILMIKDSYSTPLIPYLALGVGEIHSIYEKLFTGSIRTLIKEEKPDIVIVCYSASNILGTAQKNGEFFNLE